MHDDGQQSIQPQGPHGPACLCLQPAYEDACFSDWKDTRPHREGAWQLLSTAMQSAGRGGVGTRACSTICIQDRQAVKTGKLTALGHCGG